ncbi:hypothetical protein K1X22_01250 [Mycolicibacterium farcinogenes]|uniref:hypothetical protein n=1 Tax=Mycolicibacterium farcinogenes TaxID=1802 RepID=UPI001C8EDB70|nr:hypothetical protein [Mycolicibacterium farcinogenes]QZH60487.1 hypothetical protein K1X22_01250 [Mycolicibacterium farcinogenes]
MPRPQDVVLPILRTAVGDQFAKLGSWTEDVDHRQFPLLNVRRAGGSRPRPQLALPLVELSVYGTDSIAATERLYDDVLEALYAAVRAQTPTDAGYLHSITETVGATQVASPFQSSWLVRGTVRLGIRPS